MNTLRSALGEDWIVTKPGRGYRFVAPAWRNEMRAPPPRTDQPAGNLPPMWPGDAAEGPARLIGRSKQLRKVAALLARARLVTLTGPGGVGKTRLALQAARDAAVRFPDGVWLVELAALHDPDLVPGAVAGALGVQVGGNATAIDTLSRWLVHRSLLILLDNCEHVLGASAQLAEALLGAAPGLGILATSREALSCSGEHVLEVPPLDLPREGKMAPDAIRKAAALELFLERARRADSHFRIGDGELALAARICRRVDGLPLAIEMVAGWAGALGLETLDSRLDRPLHDWLRARSTAPPRQSTLRATLEWSHGLLSEIEKTVLCRRRRRRHSRREGVRDRPGSDPQINDCDRAGVAGAALSPAGNDARLYARAARSIGGCRSDAPASCAICPARARKGEERIGNNER
jgi:hypothetical protein